MKRSQNKSGMPWSARAAILIAALGVLLFGVWSLLRPAALPQKYSELQKGMSTADVAAVLGRPLQVDRKADGGFEWLYASPRNSVRVEFSPDERMAEYRQEGPGGMIEGYCYSSLAWAYGQVGDSGKQNEMERKALCALNDTVILRYRCEGETDAARLYTDLDKLFSEQAHLIPTNHVQSMHTDNSGAVLIGVLEPARKILEDYLRERVYTAEIIHAEQFVAPNGP